MQIRIIWPGKTKDEHLRALQADYAGRIGHFASLCIDEVRDAPARASNGELTRVERRMVEKARDSLQVALDPQGQDWTSTEFARWLALQANRGVREIAFLVGGTDGFSQALRAQAAVKLALSRMTLTRDWARTLLLEQIYRALSIARGYPYSR